MQTIVMKFNEADSIAWVHQHLSPKEKKMQVRTFYRIKGNKVGLPLHPATLQPMMYMPHQLDLIKQSLSDKQVKFHINKSRQIGLTEIVLRIIQYHSFHKYKGGKILIIAGTREKTTKTVMLRLKSLFNEIRSTVVNDKNDLHITLKNGTEIEGKPSNSEAIRGETKIKAVVIDESAHFAIVDDSVVLDAVEPK